MVRNGLPLMYRASLRNYALYPLLIVTPLGFLFKLYAGPGNRWFNDYGAGLLYELFWILVFFMAFPGRKSADRIPPWVFVVTSALECLQLCHTPLLEKIRSTFVGKTLIGTNFVGWDFPHYAAGCLLGWLYLRWIVTKMNPNGSA